MNQYESPNDLANRSVLSGVNDAEVRNSRIVQPEEIGIVSEQHAASRVGERKLFFIVNTKESLFGSRRHVDALPPKSIRNGMADVLIQVKPNS